MKQENIMMFLFLLAITLTKGPAFRVKKHPEEFIAGVKTRYGKFADDLIKAYPVGETAIPKTARDLARDAAFGWQTWSWARLQSQTGKSKVFYYYFDQHPELSRRLSQIWVWVTTRTGCCLCFYAP